MCSDGIRRYFRTARAPPNDDESDSYPFQRDATALEAKHQSTSFSLAGQLCPFS